VGTEVVDMKEPGAVGAPAEEDSQLLALAEKPEEGAIEPQSQQQPEKDKPKAVQGDASETQGSEKAPEEADFEPPAPAAEEKAATKDNE
jgi:hypothetical protein